jgi:hypothetical protein
LRPPAVFCMLGPHMESDSLDPYALDAKWQANERELNRIRAMTGLDREMHAGDAERIEGEQDAIEFALGIERPTDAASKRWSGLA